MIKLQVGGPNYGGLGTGAHASRTAGGGANLGGPNGFSCIAVAYHHDAQARRRGGHLRPGITGRWTYCRTMKTIRTITRQ